MVWGCRDRKSIMWNRTFSQDFGTFHARYHACNELRQVLQRTGCKRLIVGHTPQVRFHFSCRPAGLCHPRCPAITDLHLCPRTKVVRLLPTPLQSACHITGTSLLH